MLHWIFIYFFLALICLIAKYTWRNPLFIRTQSKHFPWKLNYNFRWWKANEWWAATVALSMLTLTGASIWKMLGGPLSPSIGKGLLLLTCFTSTIFSIRHHRLVEKFKNHSWWLTLFTAMATYILIIIASAYGDSYIFNHTRIDPQKFPLGQKAVSAVILITIWCYIATFILSIITLAKYIWDAATLHFSPYFPEKSLGVRLNRRDYKSSTAHKRSNAAKTISNAGAMFTIIILLNFWDYISNQYSRILQETLVFASFHLRPSDCGIRTNDSDSWLAPIDNELAVLAILKNSSYKFETVDCIVLSKEEIHRKTLEKLGKDDYW